MITPTQALSQLLDTVNAKHLLDDSDLELTGADPVLPTNFLLGTAGASVIAATGLAASSLQLLKTGQRGCVATDARRGAHAMRSEAYLHVEGQPAGYEWDPASGFYRTADDLWILLNCTFPHLFDGTLNALGTPGNALPVADIIRERDGLELETQLIDAGLTASLVRSHAQWQQHPHYAALSTLPVLEVTRIGDSAIEPMPQGLRPLENIRVLDLTRVIAGPMAGRTLAEHGAEVLRVSGPGLPYSKTLVMDTGHGKRAAEIDLTTEEGVVALKHLAKDADVFSQGYRPDSIAHRGLSPEVLAEIRPGIVYVSLSAFGRKGPWHHRRGFDSLLQAASGMVMEQSQNDFPEYMPAPALDYVTGYLGAFGAMIALHRRATEGGSWHVQVSLAQSGHWIDALGRIENQDARSLPEPTFESVRDLTTTSATPFGALTHLAPAV